MQKIDLTTPLTLWTAFRFPLQSSESRMEVLIGALWLCTTIPGWIANMGHRIAMTHNMQHNFSAWPSWPRRMEWRFHRQLFRDGCFTLLGMIEYHLPAVIWFAGVHLAGRPSLDWWSLLFWAVGTAAVPGYMTHYCRERDPWEIINPLRALSRVIEGGWGYWHAWVIALSALVISLVVEFILGFLGMTLYFWSGTWFVAGPYFAVSTFVFFVVSVWFWQVAGYSFANVFTKKFRLQNARARSW